MKKTITILALMCISLTAMAKQAKTVTLRLIETSDVHGAFFPYNFTERRPMQGTMARVSSYLKRQRKSYGDRIILLDNGDILQGQPTCYYTNYVKTDAPNIAAEVVNYLQYDAQNFGNHDVETGHAVYDKWVSEIKCPVLGANIIDTKTGKPYVKPYTIIEREGVRVAILGMLTPAIPSWLHESLWTGLYFEDMIKSARHWIKVLKEQEKADVIIGLFHSGWEGGIVTPSYEEDVSRKMAETVEGFDVIFFGHDHTERNATINGVLCLDPSCNAVKVAQATIQIRNGKVISKKGEIVDITGEAIDQQYMAHFQPQTDAIHQYVERQLGTFVSPMRSRDSFFGPAAFTDLIHLLQLEYTHADISFNAPLAFNTNVNAGPVYMSDMFKLYRFENKIYVLRMTGEEVRKHLEMSYDLWTNTMQSADDHIMLLAPKAPGDNQREGFKNYTFNFDSAAGIDYVVDVTKPEGQKVHILQFSDGRPFNEKAWYKVAMNSYRGNGGGELLTLGAGIPHDSINSRIIYMSERDQRYYLTQKIEREGQIEGKSFNNWRFIPDAWARPAIERDRKQIFGE
jgi:2',3'-cyclic-nucleotide 2'-phosphodiesterase/3'-nucleotidase